MFDFKHISPFDKGLIKSKSPMILFATPGMLHGGSSLNVFKEWCSDEKNTLIIPGYCVSGTIGNTLLTKMKKKPFIDKHTGKNIHKLIKIDGKEYDINMKIKNMSFSAHADAKGILNLIKYFLNY